MKTSKPPSTWAKRSPTTFPTAGVPEVSPSGHISKYCEDVQLPRQRKD